MRLFFAIIIALSSAFTYTGGAEFFIKDKNHDFTDTNEGVVLEHDYHFTNTGTAPLIISDYKVACICTKITFPKNPIAPKQSGTIHLSFDTQGKYGYQNRINLQRQKIGFFELSCFCGARNHPLTQNQFLLKI